MEPDQDGSEVLETPETETEAVETTEDVQTPDDRDARIAALEKERAELDAKNKQLYARAKEAEKKAKETPTPEVAQQGPSPTDLYALMNAKVHADDVARVEKFAKDEGISIREALSNKELKAILDVRSEERDTAAAANVSNVRRGPSKVTDDALLEQASKGKLPESEEDIARLVKAQMLRK